MKNQNLTNKISVCIDMMFASHDFFDRFEAVKRSGINTIEFWRWTIKDIDMVLRKLNELDMKISIFNMDSSDEKLSNDLLRGILNTGRVEEFISALKESIPVYKKLGAKAMIVLIGDETKAFTLEEQKENVYKCLKAAAPIVEENDVTLIVEPLNSFDRVGYSMPYVTPVLEIIERVDCPNIKILYDIYHQNMMGDFDIEEIRRNIKRIGHFHVADAPGRHEPGTGKVDYVSILNEILKMDYDGYIGLEYRATKYDSDTFGFLDDLN